MLILLQNLLLGCAAAMPLNELTINQKTLLRESAPAITTPSGFQAAYTNSEFDVTIHGVVLPDAQTAGQKAAMELANIRNLYNPHSNPYEGQVSDLVQCPPESLPKTYPLALDGIAAGQPTLLIGGVSERKLFGACTKDQRKMWGGYFQFFHEPQKMAVSVRVFYKGKAGLEAARLKIKALSGQLFAKTGQPQ